MCVLCVCVPVCHRLWGSYTGGWGGGDESWQLQLFWWGLCCCTAGGPQGGHTLIIEYCRNLPHIIIRWLTNVCGQGRLNMGWTRHGHVCLPLIKAPILKQLIVSATVYSPLRVGIVLKDYRWLVSVTNLSLIAAPSPMMPRSVVPITNVLPWRAGFCRSSLGKRCRGVSLTESVRLFPQDRQLMRLFILMTFVIIYATTELEKKKMVCGYRQGIHLSGSLP